MFIYSMIFNHTFSINKIYYFNNNIHNMLFYITYINIENVHLLLLFYNYLFQFFFSRNKFHDHIFMGNLY